MLGHLPAAIGRALLGTRPGLDATVISRDDLAASGRSLAEIGLTSSAFADGGALPQRCTDDGDGRSPPLAWTGIPPGTACLALIVEDADSPTPRPLVHAIAAPLDVSVAGFPEGGLDEDTTGRHSFLGEGWLPPDPPPAHGAHRYVFQLFALDAPVETVRGRGAFETAIAGHVIGVGLLIGTYERAPD